MKGLFKAAFYDPNPVLMLEHKGLYWSKVPGTDAAKTVEPDEDYIIPLGKGLKVQSADPELVRQGQGMVIITYGMGVHWSLQASKEIQDRVSIVDLRTLNPIDWDLIQEEVRSHSRCLVLTEEPVLNSFAESLAGRISKACWHHLDAPVSIVGAANLPAVPLNVDLEAAMLPNADKVRAEIEELLGY
jgi:2-oxoisovalerate dehydrogenase E1 component